MIRICLCMPRRKLVTWEVLHGMADEKAEEINPRLKVVFQVQADREDFYIVGPDPIGHRFATVQPQV